MGMTLTEKILAKVSGRYGVEPGENIWVNVDLLMTHDVYGPGTIGVYDITDRSNFKASPDYRGVCHIALAQEGHNRPGEVLFGN